MKRTLAFNNLKEMDVTHAKKVIKSEEIAPVVSPEQALRIKAMLSRNGEEITPWRALNAVATKEHLSTAWEREQLRRENKKELER